MHIGIIASARHAIREPFAGGLERQTHGLASALRDRGHRVTVFASADSDPELGVEPVCERESRLDLSEAATADPSMLSQRFMEEHHAYLRLMLSLQDRHDLDVVQNNSLHYLPVAMADALPVPLVTTLHTPPTPWLESALGAARHAENVTFVSVSASNALHWRRRIDEVGVIPNGIDPDRWGLTEDPEPDLAVWSGRLVPEKGPHLAIDAAHRAGLRIHLAGPVADRRYVDEEVRPRLRPGDELRGHLGHDDLARLLGRGTVALVTPCWDEPYGLVVPEALACGTPVAAFDRGAMGEILDERSGRLAPAGDVDALAEAAVAAAQLDRRDARRRAEQHCSLERMVERYEDLYRRVSGAGPSDVRPAA